MVHATLNTLLQRKRLVRASDDDHHLSRLQDSLYTHSECHLRHFPQIVVEESRIGDYGIVRQSLDPCSRGEGGAGLVEGNVSVGSDASEEEIDAPV